MGIAHRLTWVFLSMPNQDADMGKDLPCVNALKACTQGNGPRGALDPVLPISRGVSKNLTKEEKEYKIWRISSCKFSIFRSGDTLLLDALYKAICSFLW